jgi:hypothetical protein
LIYILEFAIFSSTIEIAGIFSGVFDRISDGRISPEGDPPEEMPCPPVIDKEKQP